MTSTLPAGADLADFDDDADTYEVVPKRSVVQHLADIWRYRELLRQLVRKELKVKYKNSSLGFLWSLLNPAMMVVIYYLVFAIIFKSGIPKFPIWLLSGLLVWNLFSSSLAASTASITGNSYLIGKVRFPREILPLASVGAGLVHFFLQGIVLVATLLLFRHGIAWGYVWLVPLALVTLTLFTAALALALSAINVYARDTQHLLELLLTVWFYLTPIIYPYRFASDRLTNTSIPAFLPLLNPITSVVMAFQRSLYGIVETRDSTGAVRTAMLPAHADQLWYLRNLGIVFAITLGLFVVAIKVFDRAEGNFAEVM